MTQNVLIDINERIRYVMTVLRLKEKVKSVNFPVGVNGKLSAPKKMKSMTVTVKCD